MSAAAASSSSSAPTVTVDCFGEAQHMPWGLPPGPGEGPSSMTLGAAYNLFDCEELLEASILMAHERGEFMPRDAMSALLSDHGIEPPDLAAEEDTEAIEAGAFVCKRCRKARPGLEDAPFSGELGARVQEDICVDCWKEWMAMSIKVINEFRLNMATPEANDIYESNLREFLGV